MSTKTTYPPGRELIKARRTNYRLKSLIRSRKTTESTLSRVLTENARLGMRLDELERENFMLLNAFIEILKTLDKNWEAKMRMGIPLRDLIHFVVIGVKYGQFDLEATWRENDYLKKLLE